MEIILLLLGDKRGDSEQHEYFHWSLFITPSNHPINTRIFSKGYGS